jgi:hypothetical protein
MLKRYACLLLVSGCVVNGRSVVGPSTSPQPSSSSTAVETSTGEARDPDDPQTTDPPYPTAPADPWAAVAGDQPLRLPRERADHWIVRGSQTQCTAVRDHCLVKETWFFVQQSMIDRKAQYPNVLISAGPAIFGPDRPYTPANTRSPLQSTADAIAFRTVPATKRNLVPGAYVIGIPHGDLPYSGVSAIGAGWQYGELESVDYDAGVYQLKDYPDTMPLAGARVVVLAWKPGGKVEIVGKQRREQLAVSAADVFLP